MHIIPKHGVYVMPGTDYSIHLFSDSSKHLLTFDMEPQWLDSACLLHSCRPYRQTVLAVPPALRYFQSASILQLEYLLETVFQMITTQSISRTRGYIVLH